MSCRLVAIVHLSIGYVLEVVLVRLCGGSVVQKIVCEMHRGFVSV